MFYFLIFLCYESFFFVLYVMFYNTLSVVLWLIQRCLLSIHTMFYNVLSDVLL